MDTAFCISPAAVAVIIPAAPLPAPPTLNIVQPTCNETTGTIKVTAPVGNGFSYAINGGPFQQSPLFAAIAPGSFPVVAKDSSGCMSAATIAVVRAYVNTLTANLAIELPDCNSFGSITVSATGGASPYRYSINGSGYLQANTFNALHAGVYRVEVVDAAGCTTAVRAELPLKNNFKMRLSATPQPILQGSTIGLQSTSIIDYAVSEWAPKSLFSDQTKKFQQITADSSMAISVIGVSRAGCIDTAVVFVSVQPFNNIYVPNAFTPNADGKNDILKVRGKFSELELNIYNRFGQLVFRSSNNVGWDGNSHGVPQPAGTYVYVLQANNGGKRIHAKGTILLVR